jgi:hypothetical protein
MSNSPNTQYRAAKSGFAREAHEKVLAKYDVNQANIILDWISKTIEEEFDTSGYFSLIFCLNNKKKTFYFI